MIRSEYAAPAQRLVRQNGGVPGNLPFARSRRALLVSGCAVIVAGLLVRSVPGAVGDVAGGILYAVLVFVLVALVFPATAGLRIGVMSLAVCVAVELLQLTGLPAVAAELLPPIRYVLGTTFVAADLIAYAGGSGLAVLVDRGLRWRTRTRADQ